MAVSSAMDFSPLQYAFTVILSANPMSRFVSYLIAYNICGLILIPDHLLVVVMYSPNNSHYSDFYFATYPDLPIICEVTPMITTVRVQYNENGLVNVTSILNQTQLPNDGWPLIWYQGGNIWAAYFLSQGLYSNSLADSLIQEVESYSSSHPPTNGSAILMVNKYSRLASNKLVELMVK